MPVAVIGSALGESQYPVFSLILDPLSGRHCISLRRNPPYPRTTPRFSLQPPFRSSAIRWYAHDPEHYCYASSHSCQPSIPSQPSCCQPCSSVSLPRGFFGAAQGLGSGNLAFLPTLLHVSQHVFFSPNLTSKFWVSSFEVLVRPRRRSNRHISSSVASCSRHW